jgi:hypothetical protein
MRVISKPIFFARVWWLLTGEAILVASSHEQPTGGYDCCGRIAGREPVKWPPLTNVGLGGCASPI